MINSLYINVRSTDVEEMKAFRESVVSGHSQQIQAITTLLEKERSQNTSLRNELDDLSSDMREYRNQAKEMEHMEEMVSSFKSRYAVLYLLNHSSGFSQCFCIGLGKWWSPTGY